MSKFMLSAVFCLFASMALASGPPPKQPGHWNPPIPFPNPPIPVPHPGISPFNNILQYAVDDINSAIKLANDNNDADAAACYTNFLAGVNAVQGHTIQVWPPHLLTDFETLRILKQDLSALKNNKSCAIVCFQAASAIPVYGAAGGAFCTAISQLP